MDGSIEMKSDSLRERERELEDGVCKTAISFDEALAMTGFGKFNYFVILIGGLNMIAVLLEILDISFVLPVSECDMNLTTQDKGILSGVVYAGIISGSHLWGFLADTKGRRKVMQPTLFLAFASTFMSSLTNNFWLFAIFRFMNGFFMAGSAAPIYAYLGELHNEHRRSQVIMYASLVFGCSSVMLPGIAYLIINADWQFYIPIIDIVYKPYKLYLVVSGLPELLCSLGLLVLPESPKFVLAQGKQAETIEILQKINRWNNGGKQAKPLQIFEIREEIEAIENRKKIAEIKNSNFPFLKAVWMQTAPLFQETHLRKTLLLCLILFGVSAASNGMYMWLPDILNRMSTKMNELPGQPLSLCNAVYLTKLNVTSLDYIHDKICLNKLESATYGHGFVLEILFALSFAVIGVVIKSAGKILILSIILTTGGIAGISAAIIDIPLVAIYSYVMLIVCGVAVNVANALAIDLYPTNLRAMAVCVSGMVGRSGPVFLAYLVGLLLENHCETAFLIPGVFLIGCAMSAFLIPKVKNVE